MANDSCKVSFKSVDIDLNGCSLNVVAVSTIFIANMLMVLWHSRLYTQLPFCTLLFKSLEESLYLLSNIYNLFSPFRVYI